MMKESEGHVCTAQFVLGTSYNRDYAFVGMIRWTTTVMPAKKKK
jgi:hypothetical protein